MADGPDTRNGCNTPPGDDPPAAVVTVEVLREEEPPDLRLIAAPVNDLTHAELFAERFGNEFAHVRGVGWYRFNGRYWGLDAEVEARSCAGQINKSRVDALDRLVASPGVPDATLARAAVKLRQLEKHGNRRSLDGVVELAADYLGVAADRFDQDPWLLNADNGVIDLRNGALLPHDPQQYQSRCTGIIYDPEARSELWENTVYEVSDGDAELASFHQVVGGVVASGDASIQRFLFYFGAGANGKSLMTALMAEALGGFGATGYAVRLPCETVAGHRERDGDAPAPSLLALRGKRLALFDEQNADKAFNAERIKNLTGGDAQYARAPHKANGVTFAPTWTLIGAGNHKPLVHASDYGLWRRMLLVPFRRTFKPSSLADDLRRELPAILAWMVRGAIRFYQEKELVIPDIIKQESRAYQIEADIILLWMAERASAGDRPMEEDGKVLFREFDTWRDERRETVITHSMFSRRLKQLNWTSRDSNGHTLWRRPHVAAPPAPEPSEKPGETDQASP